MGTTDLHQILRSLCLNTVWKYAVYWKLRHRSRMVLTWEDAYYDSCEQQDPSENNCLSETPETLLGGHYSHDPLGLAVAKMSYHVYSLGEGIVGRVAVSGTHQWIFSDSDNHVNTSCSSSKFCDGWQSQFAAGIRTIALVAVVPRGVVQLGSLSEVIEDVKVVSHIRDIFLALQDSSVGHVTAPIECNMKIPIAQPDLHIKGLASDVFSLDKAVNKEGQNGFFPEFSYFQKHSRSSYVFPMSDFCPQGAVEVVKKNEGVKLSTEGSGENKKLLTRRSDIANLESQDKVGTGLISDRLCEGKTSGWKNVILKSEENVSDNSVMSSVNFFNVALQAEEFGVDLSCFTSNLHDSALSDRVKSDDMDQTELLKIPESSDLKFHKDFEKLESQSSFNHLDSMNALTFTAGCELYEALGPVFLKKSISANWKAENTEAGANIEMPEGMSSSQPTFESGSENLLEAMVANVCHNGNNMESEKSFCRSLPSTLTDENNQEPSNQTKCTINSAGYSINQPSLMEKNTQNGMNSVEFCGAMSSKGFSSTCPSSCCEQLKRPSEPVKNNKKRTRPGESGRPRPRDRQLIQDRIKELRELVPNGGKCSIDSLLERTIKHMLFLQSITKHADKLSKGAESKNHYNRTGTQELSNYEQGSSWAVEVGSHLKVCSIIVENLNKNGHMLVEMWCEECSHFLEIVEVIRSLGLTILKGVTQAHGGKTWICFVVEGQNNRVMHRMDILWPLVQILQSKATG